MQTRTLIIVLIILNLLCIYCFAEDSQDELCDELLESANKLLNDKPPHAREAATKYEEVKKKCPEKIGQDLLCQMADAYNRYNYKNGRNKVCSEIVNKEGCFECNDDPTDEDSTFNYELSSSTSPLMNESIVKSGLALVGSHNILLKSDPTSFDSTPIVINNSLYKNGSFFILNMNPGITWDFESGLLRG
jgi:hypothetical protein